MKYATLALIGLTLSVGEAGLAPARAQTPKASDMKTTEQKAAYTVGVSMGRQLKQSGAEFDPALVVAGVRDGMGETVALTEDQMAEVMEAFKKQMMAKMGGAGGAGAGASSPAAEKNLKDGQAFLARNKTQPGVTTLPSGVQYKVLKQGSGATPKLSDTVKANYKGTLIDGKEFDSSYKRGEASEFPVQGVIPGWTEILQKMKVGDKFQVFIPSELAYGPSQRGPLIAPNSALVFEIELVEIVK